MKQKADNPGVVIPPPFIYAVIFLLSILVQKFIPLNNAFMHRESTHYIGYAIIGVSLLFTIPALLQFFRTKNTLIPHKPANSLQTTGIYSITRNPMYLGLLVIYTGIALEVGNPWTLLFIPIVMLVITRYVIINEEKYLERAFDNAYLEYKTKVRRWI